MRLSLGEAQAVARLTPADGGCTVYEQLDEADVGWLMLQRVVSDGGSWKQTFRISPDGSAEKVGEVKAETR